MKFITYTQKALFGILLLAGMSFSALADFTPQSPAFPHGDGIARTGSADGSQCGSTAGNQCPSGLSFPSFNNFTDSGQGEGINDERKFLALINQTVNPTGVVMTNSVAAEIGQQIYARAYVHNNGYLNDPNVTASNVKIGMTGFTHIGNGVYESVAGTSISLRQFIDSSNATPSQVTDDAFVTSTSGKKIKLQFRTGTHTLRTTRATDTVDPGSFFSSAGHNIGDVKGCSENAFYTQVTFWVVNGEEPKYDLTINKTVNSKDSENSTIGGTLNYRIDIENLSSSTDSPTTVTIYDNYDESKITIDASTLPTFCTDDGDKLTCPIPSSVSFPPGQTAHMSYTATIKSAVTGTIVNTAEVIPSPDYDTNPDNDTDSVTVTITNTPDPDVTIDKYVNGVKNYTAQPGQTVTYTLKYRNISPTTAQNITISDLFPNQYLENVVITSKPANMTCTVSNVYQSGDPYYVLLSEGKIDCSGQTTLTQAQGDQTITFTARVKANTPVGTIFRNNVRVDAANEPAVKNDILNTSYADITVATTLNPSCGTNTKNYLATDQGYPTRIKTAFCANGNPNPYSLSYPYKPEFPVIGGTVTWQCEIAGKNPVTCTATRGVAQKSNVKIVKSVNKTVEKVGETLTYTLRYNNLSDIPATGVVISDDYPEEYLENVIVTSKPNNVTCQTNILLGGSDPLLQLLLGKRGLKCTVSGNLTKANTDYVITYTARIKAGVSVGTFIDNTVTITSTNEDPTKLADNKDTDRVTVTDSTSYDLEIIKKVNNLDSMTVTPSSEVTFTVSYKNQTTSTKTAENVKIIDTYDSAKLDVVNSSLPAGCIDNTVGTITCSIGSLAPSNGTTLTYKATLKPGFTTGSTVNKVEITSPTTNNTDFTNDKDEVTIAVTAAALPLCGTNKNDSYPSATANYPSRNKIDFCSVGEVYYNNVLVTNFSTLPPFPAKGSSIQWNCRVNNNTTTQTTCGATRQDDATDTFSCSINASPTTINVGNSATLTWDSTGATTATLNQAIGSVSVDGTRTVAPQNDTTYILTISNGTETKQCSTKVTVLRPSAPNPPGGGGGGGGGACNINGTIDLNIAKYIKVANGAFVPASSENIAANLSAGNNSVVYKIVVSNAGSASAYNTKVKDIFASANGFTQRNIGNVSGASFNPATSVFTFNYLIPANGSKEFVYSAQINAVDGGLGKNTARIESFTTPYSCPYITSEKGIGRSATTFVKSGEMLEAKYFLDKRVNKSEVKAGEEIFYTLILKNRGDIAMENVVLYDRFPSEYLEPVDKSNLTNNRTLQFSRHLLQPNEEFRVKVKMIVRAGVPEGTKMVNVLTASSDNIEINTSDEEVVTVVENPAQTPTCPGGYNYDQSRKMCKLVSSGIDIPALPIGAVLLGLAMVWRREDISQMFV